MVANAMLVSGELSCHSVIDEDVDGSVNSTACHHEPRMNIASAWTGVRSDTLHVEGLG